MHTDPWQMYLGVEAVINTGIAGSLNNDVNIGDIVLSTDVLHHDMDAIGFGYKKGQIPQMDEFSSLLMKNFVNWLQKYVKK